MRTYCIFRPNGTEKTVMRLTRGIDRETEAISPVRILQEKRAGSWQPRSQPLLPGYLFVYAEKDIPVDEINAPSDVYKVLGYEAEGKGLIGPDYEYAMWIYRHNGEIGASEIILEGSTVRVVSGPLLDGIGTIRKLDRHKRRAVVEFNFYGKMQRISLSVLDISSC